MFLRTSRRRKLSCKEQYEELGCGEEEDDSVEEELVAKVGGREASPSPPPVFLTLSVIVARFRGNAGNYRLSFSAHRNPGVCAARGAPVLPLAIVPAVR